MAKQTKKEKDPNQDDYTLISKFLNNSFGDGTIIDLTRGNHNVKRISTGDISLDYVLGGGWPTNRVIEIYGNNSVGKTTMVCKAIQQFQLNDNRPVLLIDAENKIDLEYAQELGVDIHSKFIFSQSMCIETIGDVVDRYSEAGLSAVFIDSLASIYPRKEMEGDMDYNDHGIKQKKIGQLLRKLSEISNRCNTMICLTNQMRVGQGHMFTYEYTPGGKAKDHHVAVKLKLQRISGENGMVFGKGKQEIGHKIEVYAEKNQTAQPHRKRELKIIWGEGFDRSHSLAELSLAFDVLKQGGAWYEFPNGEKIQGFDNVCKKLANDEVLYDDIFSRTKAAIEQEG